MTQTSDNSHISISPENTPQCIGFIMDGNRRWAREHGYAKLAGHKAGYDKLLEVAEWTKEAGISYLVVYAFSTENWHRSEEEVGYLLDLFRQMADDWKEKSAKENIRVRFVGDPGQFPEDIQNVVADLEEATKENTALTVVIALSYGGRAEIVHAVNRLPKERIGDITESEFEAYLWTHDIPDLDMIVRTSGEQRLSGFMTWRSIYSELFFTSTYWPAFTKEEFKELLEGYAQRTRRIGK